jgi:hypothetical protein
MQTNEQKMAGCDYDQDPEYLLGYVGPYEWDIASQGSFLAATRTQ